MGMRSWFERKKFLIALHVPKNVYEKIDRNYAHPPHQGATKDTHKTKDIYYSKSKLNIYVDPFFSINQTSIKHSTFLKYFKNINQYFSKL